MNSGVRQTRNAYKYMLQAGAGAFLSFITLPIYTRILSPSDFGELALAQVYAVLMISIANFGFTEAVERNYFQYRDNSTRQGQLLFTAIIFVTLFSITLIFGTYIFMKPVAKIMGMQGNGIFFLWAMIGQAAASINVYYLMYLKNNAEAGRFAFYSILVATVNALIGIYFVVVIKTGPLGVLYALVISGTIGAALLTVTFSTRYRPSINYAVFLDVIKIAYPLTPRILVGTFSAQLDKYLIRIMGTLSSVGIYAVAQRIAYFVFYFMTVLQNVFAPEVYKRLFSEETSDKQQIGGYLTTFLYISTLFALTVVLFSQEIVYYLLGSEYAAAAEIIIVLAAFYAVQFPGKVTSKQLVYAKKTALISVLSIIYLVVSVLVMIPLVMSWGALGAAWGALITGILSNTVSLIVAQRYHKIDWQFGRMLSIYFIFAAGMAIALVYSNENNAILTIILFKLGILLAYIAYGVSIGVVSRNNFGVLYQAVQKKGVSELEKY